MEQIKTVRVKGEYLEFVHRNGFVYDVLLESVRSDLEGWTSHLQQKMWFTSAVEDKMLQLI